MVSTSQTYNFSPSTGELIQSAFGRLQKRRTEINTEMMVDGQQEANFALVEAANKGPNLWTVDLQSVTLVQGTATYTVPPETVMMLDVNLTIQAIGGQPIDRQLQPLSRTDYSQIPNKEQQGPPTSFWFDRLIAPTVTMWPTPDGNGPYTLTYYRFRQMQDANLTAGQNAEIPYLFLDWFVATISHRLSRYYAPALEMVRKQDAMDAWMAASNQGTEYAPLAIAPMLGSFYR